MFDKEKVKLFYEADTLEHQRLVARRMIMCAINLIERASEHDVSKFSDIEREAYEIPVWKLNHEDIKFGSDEYKSIVKKMGKGLIHHHKNNDHHPEYYGSVGAMNMFSLIEMLCDWIAAAKRKGNDPHEGMKVMKEKFNVFPQLECVLRNTLRLIENNFKEERKK